MSDALLYFVIDPLSSLLDLLLSILDPQILYLRSSIFCFITLLIVDDDFAHDGAKELPGQVPKSFELDGHDPLRLGRDLDPEFLNRLALGENPFPAVVEEGFSVRVLGRHLKTIAVWRAAFERHHEMRRFSRRVCRLVNLDIANRNGILLPEIFEPEFAPGQRAA